ncbi:hypothetical protein B4U37_14855 [Sutcliffiella horikoshii]|uniref:Uncharacterized protein n=1 Tax=Sutcliffiella horikoshii TaxID=79883 RepID=A0ABN4ZFP5_9BACI|nr:hypothetical protein [Sutcliffiella horikoshii]ART77247.1 hypothetical protein B4U37_14855 [Sutcliffiella horikoshii]
MKIIFVFGLTPLFLSANGFAFRGTVLEPPRCATGSQATVTPPLESTPFAPIHSWKLHKSNFICFSDFFFSLKLNEVTLLIGVEGAQTPAGGRDRGDPGGKAEEAPGPPAGKRSAWNGNQPDYMLS